MIKPISLFVGLKFTKSKTRQGFVSFISFLSIIGVTLGVWALISVLSVMNGFEKELKSRIISAASHVTVTGQSGWLHNWEEILGEILEVPGVLNASPFINSQALLTNENLVAGVFIKGIEPRTEKMVSDIYKNILIGDWESLKPGKWNIIIGDSLASNINANIGDQITLIAPKGRITPMGLTPRMKRFTVGAIFKMDMHEYDSGIAFININDSAQFLENKDFVSGLRLKTEEVYKAPLVTKQIQDKLGSDYHAYDWTVENRNLFSALKLERKVMFIILILIIMVAAFNIVSTLVMVVSNKKSDIAILRTIGFTPWQIMTVFFTQGLIIGGSGTILGACFGIITGYFLPSFVPWIENILNIEFFPSSVYVISQFPSDLIWTDVILVSVVSFLICALATLYPAWRASRTQPSEALRYE